MKNLSRILQLTTLWISIIGASFFGGALFYKEVLSLNENRTTSFNQPEIDKLFQPFFEAWDAVHSQYYQQPVEDMILMQGAILGMMESLGDPHSSYMDPDEYRQQNAPLQGEYTGIGAWVDTSGEFLTIISPMPNSPAEMAGIKSNDIVIAVDGRDMTKKDPATVLRYILGPAGEKVILTISRDGMNELLNIEIIRAVIEVPPIEYRMLDNQIAYIRLFQYSINAAQEIENALFDLLEEDPIGLIFDLRNNSGGYLDAAIEVTSLFIDNGTLMIEEWGDGRRQDYKANGNVITQDLPLVILVNEGSASASEITAGAIQDYQRGILIGTTTYGKGLIQNWIELQGENGAIRVSIARWLTPKGRQIHLNGLSPDIFIENDDNESENDLQLEKAIEYLIMNSQNRKSVGQK